MEQLETYKKLIGKNDAESVFEYLISSLKPSIKLWDYFINWKKVFHNLNDIEIELNTLNYLIGKEDFDSEFKNLVRRDPSILRAIPALSVRGGSNDLKFKVLVDFSNSRLIYEDFDFSKRNPTDEDINGYIKFLEKTEIKRLIQSRRVKNLVDYVIGVEAGLDSNARKNRGGIAMEIIVEQFISSFCLARNFTYLRQASAKLIFEEWGIAVPVDKSSRNYDFTINTGSELIIVETNFYGGGGSKLKATAGEYRTLKSKLDSFKFVWITDGEGWLSAHLPLREAYNEIDYIFNLNMIENGILNDIV